jgi:hypothetical protein
METQEERTGGNPDGCKVISLSATPPKMDALVAMVNAPADIDDATIELGIPPILMNIQLAVPFDLSFLNIGLANSVYVPRQITAREGGRKSLYLLCVGETAQAGVYFTSCGMLVRYVTRLTGDSSKAKSGDIYMEQLKTRDGRLVYEGTGVLKIIDIKKGMGEILLAQTKTPQFSVGAKETPSVWIIWSCINIG